MYWRVRNLGPEHLIRQYGVHALLIVSLAFSLVLFISRPSTGKRGLDIHKVGMEQLARDVTLQLLDSSYISFAANTQLLLTSGELHPTMIQKLKANGLVPKSPEEAKATVRQLTEEKVVVAVRIDSVSTGEPIGQQGFVPIDVAGQVATHSASGADEKRFHLRYFMGLINTGEQVQQQRKTYTSSGGAEQVQVPIVIDYQEVAT